MACIQLELHDVALKVTCRLLPETGSFGMK